MFYVEQASGFSSGEREPWGQTRDRELLLVSLQGCWVQETRPTERAQDAPSTSVPSILCGAASLPPLPSPAWLQGAADRRGPSCAGTFPRATNSPGGLGYILKVANFLFQTTSATLLWALSSLSSTHRKLILTRLVSIESLPDLGIQRTLSVVCGHHSKHFANSNAFNLHNNSSKQILLSLFYK